MEYDVKIGTLAKQRSACLLLGIFNDRPLPEYVDSLDKETQKQLKQYCTQGDLAKQAGQTWLLPQLERCAFARIILVNCGPYQAFTDKVFRQVTQRALDVLKELNCRDAIHCLPVLPAHSHTPHWCLRQTLYLIEETFYRFDQCKSKKADAYALRRITFMAPDAKHAKDLRERIQEHHALAKGMRLTKDLGNLPANICTPTYLAKEARNLARRYPSLKVSVLEEAQMRKLGMGSLLSVSQGSIQPPKLIILEYKGGAKNAAPIALVGKGVTFDSGGISIKPAANMDEMKFDMSGAGSVLGTLLSTAELQLPINVVGIIAAVENMPSHQATKPGDIVTSMSGQTIEIINTDAEGRLILCDALTYCQRYKPHTIIDIATLTGAISIALGKEAAGVFTTDDTLAAEIATASELSADRSWRMPLWPEFQDALQSNFADFVNCGDRQASSCTAAAFLANFTQNQRWAHLDIAGVAYLTGKNKGATGRPVPLLLALLQQRSKR